MLDHIRKSQKVKHGKERIRGRAYSKMNRKDFINDIANQDWGSIYQSNDPELAWSLFKQNFLKILDNHAPYKWFNSRINRKPYVTNELPETQMRGTS